jgi:hypothetical protein
MIVWHKLEWKKETAPEDAMPKSFNYLNIKFPNCNLFDTIQFFGPEFYFILFLKLFLVSTFYTLLKIYVVQFPSAINLPIPGDECWATAAQGRGPRMDGCQQAQRYQVGSTTKGANEQGGREQKAIGKIKDVRRPYRGRNFICKETSNLGN